MREVSKSERRVYVSYLVARVSNHSGRTKQIADPSMVKESGQKLFAFV